MPGRTMGCTAFMAWSHGINEESPVARVGAWNADSMSVPSRRRGPEGADRGAER